MLQYTSDFLFLMRCDLLTHSLTFNVVSCVIAVVQFLTTRVVQ